MRSNERSAGVILFRLDELGTRLYLLLDYGRYWDYAKGHVEVGEDDKTAALREVREETGIDQVRMIDGYAHELAYFFRAKTGLVRKAVVLFVGEVSSDRVTLSAEHVDYAWLPYLAALERLHFTSAKDALKSADAFLTSL